MSEENKLTTYGMSPSDFGKAMIEEATNRSQKEKLEKSVRYVQNLNAAIDECNSQIAHQQKWVSIFNAQLAAISSGEYTITKSGSITFNDSKLNEPSPVNGLYDPRANY